MNFILGAFIFTMVPTALEVALVAGLLGYSCGISFGILTIGSLSAYTFFTLAVTQWRLAFRWTISLLIRDKYGLGRE